MAKDIKKVSKFILGLLEILNQQKYNEIIKWTTDGTGVQILNRKLLQTIVCIDHFKLKKVTSFIRQLHLYGFYKSKSQKKANIFEHPFFIKTSAEDYSLIKRKYKDKDSQYSKSSLETESSEQKQQIKETAIVQLESIKSLSLFLLGSSQSRVCSNQVFFEEWYMNKEQDLSFFLDECLN